MALQFVYIAIMIAGVLLTIGLIYKDYVMTVLASFFITIIGIYTYTNGVAEINNYVSSALSISFIAIGCYFMVTEGIKFMQEYLD